MAELQGFDQEEHRPEGYRHTHLLYDEISDLVETVPAEYWPASMRKGDEHGKDAVARFWAFLLHGTKFGSEGSMSQHTRQ